MNVDIPVNTIPFINTTFPSPFLEKIEQPELQAAYLLLIVKVKSAKAEWSHNRIPSTNALNDKYESCITKK